MLVLTIQSLFISYGIRLVFGLEVGSGWVIAYLGRRTDGLTILSGVTLKCKRAAISTQHL